MAASYRLRLAYVSLGHAARFRRGYSLPSSRQRPIDALIGLTGYADFAIDFVTSDCRLRQRNVADGAYFTLYRWLRYAPLYLLESFYARAAMARQQQRTCSESYAAATAPARPRIPPAATAPKSLAMPPYHLIKEIRAAYFDAD